MAHFTGSSRINFTADLGQNFSVLMWFKAGEAHTADRDWAWFGSSEAQIYHEDVSVSSHSFGGKWPSWGGGLASFEIDTIHSIYLEYNGAGNASWLWLDGARVGSVGNAPALTATSWDIGNLAGGSAGFLGNIFNVATYNRVLSFWEFTQHHSAGQHGRPHPRGLVTWHPLLEDLTDHSGNEVESTATAVTLDTEDLPEDQKVLIKRRRRRHRLGRRDAKPVYAHGATNPSQFWIYTRFAADTSLPADGHVIGSPGETMFITNVLTQVMPETKWWAARLNCFDTGTTTRWGVQNMFAWLPFGMHETTQLATTGSATSFASTPHHASLNVAANFEVSFCARATDWTPAALKVIAAKWTAGQQSWRVVLNSAGTLSLAIGGGIVATSTVATGITDGTYAKLRITRNSTTGAVNFYKADSLGVWQALGAEVSAAAGAIPNSTSALRFGQDGDAVAGSGWVGSLFWLIVRDGINGTIVAEPRYALRTAGETATFNDSTGKTWTHAGTIELNPDFTSHADVSFPLDAYTQRVAAGTFGWLLDDFVEAWSNFLGSQPNLRVLFYLGWIFDHTSFEGLTDAESIALADANLAPIMTLFETFGERVEIGIDTSGIIPETHWLWTWRNQLTALGMSVSCEPLALEASAAQWAAGPAVATEAWWNNRSGNGSVSDEETTGPVRVLIVTETTYDEMRWRATERMTDGRAVDFLFLDRIWNLQYDGYEFADLVKYP